MSVIVDGCPAIRGVDRACANCGSAELYSGAAATLCGFEIRYLRGLLDKEQAFAAAVASARNTDAATLDLPLPGQLDDIGLSARISGAMILDPRAVDRNSLFAHLWVGPGRHRLIDVPGPLGAVRVDEYAVTHLEENRYQRWDRDHVGYVPLVESTLKHPFEIWFGAGSQLGDAGRPNYRFLALYQLGAAYITHVVIYNPRRKKVVTSHRVTGWKNTMHRRRGVPIYGAYVRKKT